MHFDPNALYHIYNRSNETVFITRENYLFFLRKVRKLIAPVCNIFAYVLMPNHFHFLIQATEESLYIHQNPVMAGLASKLEEWEFSSFRDYAGFRNGTLIQKDLAFSFIQLDKKSFYEQSMQILDEDILKKLY